MDMDIMVGTVIVAAMEDMDTTEVMEDTGIMDMVKDLLILVMDIMEVMENTVMEVMVDMDITVDMEAMDMVKDLLILVMDIMEVMVDMDIMQVMDMGMEDMAIMVENHRI